MEVARILTDFDLVAEKFPIVHNDGGGAASAHGEIEHHGPDTAFAVATFADVGEDHVNVTKSLWTG